MKKLLIATVSIALAASAGVAFARQTQLLQKNALTTAYDYWNFNGSNSNDYFGHYNGTAANITYSTAAGYFGTVGASFNGSNSKINFANANFSGNTFTLGAWADPTQISNSNDGKIIDIKGTSRLTLLYGASNGGTCPNQFGFIDNATEICGPTISFGKYYLVVGTYNAITGIGALYVNGLLVATSSVSGALSLTSYYEIGNEAGDVAARYYEGYLDDVSFLQVALSSAQVADLYTSRSLEGNGISH